MKKIGVGQMINTGVSPGVVAGIVFLGAELLTPAFVRYVDENCR